MARRRFRSNQRHEPTTERSFQEYILSTPAPQTSRTELLRLIRGGEDTFLELKVKLSNTEKIAQEIVALANTGGGVIVFGVNDQLRVEGLDDPDRVQDDLVRICREEVQPPLVPFIDRIALDNGRRIVALDIATGKRRWNFRADLHTDSTPFLAGGRLFFGSGASRRFKQSYVVCLDAKSGDLVWRTPVTLPAWAGSSARPCRSRNWWRG